MSYKCSNDNLEEVLKIIKSYKGQNAVWNVDDNTIYYNNNSLPKEMNSRGCLPGNKAGGYICLSKAIQESKIENKENKAKMVKV